MAESREVNYKPNTSEEERWKTSLGTMLGSIDFKESQACSISIVPYHLRKSNEDAYIPKVVSIGPLHRKSKRDLLYMEEIKWRCMLSLLCRTEDAIKSLEECSTAMLKLDEIVRASYLDDIKFDSYDLAKIMLLDGCFLLELLISGSKLNNELPRLEESPGTGAEVGKMKELPPLEESSGTGAEVGKRKELLRSESPSPGAEVGKREDILSDLTVLENQIPFVVLNTLSKLLFPKRFKTDEGPKEIKDLALSVFKPFLKNFPGHDEHKVINNSCSNIHTKLEAAHLLELFHSFIIGKEGSKESCNLNNRGHRKLKRCATRLEAAGVIIKANLAKQAAPAGFDFNIEFSFRNRKLVIPQLHVTETTEIRWRNFIAWEQNRHVRAKLIGLKQSEESEGRISCKFSWYALFFRGLICCVHDIQLLRDKNVIVVHHAKSSEDDDDEENRKKIMSNEDLLTLFSKITEGFEDVQIDMDTHFSELFKDLNWYSSTEDPATETQRIV